MTSRHHLLAVALATLVYFATAAVLVAAIVTH